uniref:Uncharacterized protein n=1 Tax=Helianthus annuus TaxID=4232 RepID=A0A251TVG3_HELAN
MHLVKRHFGNFLIINYIITIIIILSISRGLHVDLRIRFYEPDLLTDSLLLMGKPDLLMGKHR